MSKIVVLGGAGAQGLFSIEALLQRDVFDEIVVASRNLERTQEVLNEKFNSSKLKAAQVDVLNKDSLMNLIKDADVVANCTGPYYTLAEPIIDTVIEAGKDYVDFCDDIAAHEKIFTPEREKLAKEKGIRLIVGLGSSPGTLPLTVLYASTLMDEVDDVTFYLAISDREPEGPAVLHHTMENFIGGVPVIKDGKRAVERDFEGEVYYDFGEPFGVLPISSIGHPETFSLPRVLPNIKNLSIKLGLYPIEIQRTLKILTKTGLTSTEPIEVNGQTIIPRDVTLTSLEKITPRTELFENEHPEPLSSSAIEIRGKKDGNEILFKTLGYGNMGPATGYPLAVGAEMLAQGKIEKIGLMVPEECIDPLPFIAEVGKRVHEAEYETTSNTEIITYVK